MGHFTKIDLAAGNAKNGVECGERSQNKSDAPVGYENHARSAWFLSKQTIVFPRPLTEGVKGQAFGAEKNSSLAPRSRRISSGFTARNQAAVEVERNMGLDQYAIACPAKLVGDDQIDVELDDANVSVIHRWRKHPNLHGWMENLYRAKGGKEEFNCATVRLDLDDLAALEKVLIKSWLPTTTGFFFGKSDPHAMEDDLAFIAKARVAIAFGSAVFYDSWW